MASIKFAKLVSAGLGTSLGIYAIRHKQTHRNIVLAERNIPEGLETESNALNNLQLLNVQVFGRHGARTPIHIIETIEHGTYLPAFMGDLPYTKIDYEVKDVSGDVQPISLMENSYRDNNRILKGGVYVGQLTKIGQDQMYMLGKTLRKKYVDELKLLSPEIKDNEVYIRSSNVERNIVSARCAMAGLFNTAYTPQTNGPITIYVSDATNEILYPNTYHCPTMRTLFGKWIKQAWNLPSTKRIRQQVQERSDYVEKDGKFLNLIDVRDDLIARKTHGIEIPNNLEELLPEIETCATLIATIQLCGPPEKRHLNLSVGPVLQVIQENIDQAEKSSYKLFFYASHDSMLLPLAVSLGVFDDKWIPFAGDLRIECYRDTIGDKYIRTLYCGKESPVTGQQSALIPLSTFKSVIGEFRLDRKTYDDLCETQKEDEERHKLELRTGYKIKITEEATTAAGM